MPALPIGDPVSSSRHPARALVRLVRMSRRHRNQTSADLDHVLGEPWLRYQHCEDCGQAGYAESSGDGQVTCFLCGEESEGR